MLFLLRCGIVEKTQVVFLSKYNLVLLNFYCPNERKKKKRQRDCDQRKKKKKKAA